MLRSAVERQFEIIGDAVAQLVSNFPDSGKHITKYKEIVSLRNMLIHGYSFVNDEIVWSVIRLQMEELYNEITTFLTRLEN